jgi:pyruvate dehydrogenase E1 component
MEVERWNRLHPIEKKRRSHIENLLGATATPVVAVTDFLRIVSEQVATFVPSRRFLSLGTDGMGRSDTREALRQYFENDMPSIVVTVLHALQQDGKVTSDVVEKALDKYNIAPNSPSPFLY